MKTFHKNYTLAELKIIIKSWNKHFRIMVTGKKKKELADELSKHLEHDEDDEIQLKKHSVDFKPVLKKHRDDEATKKVAKKAKAEDVKTEKERDRLKAIVVEKEKQKADETKGKRGISGKIYLTDEEYRAIAKKEEQRVSTYSNTDATASLPNEMLKLIYNFLPPGVRDRVEEGTDEEQDDLKFKRKFKELMKEKEGIENLPKKITVKEKTQKYLELLSKLNEAVRLQKISVDVYKGESRHKKRYEKEEVKLRKLYDEINLLEDIKSVKKALRDRPDSRSIQQRDPHMGGLY